MEAISNGLAALFRQPIALVLALGAVVCAVYGVLVIPYPKTPHPVLKAVAAWIVAVVSGTTAWAMATGWTWPR